MNYTGTKYSQVEARAIMATARANIQLGRADDARRRDGGVGRFVTKTVEKTRTAPASEPVPAQETTTMDAQTAGWVAWVNGRIEEKCNTIVKVCGAASGKLWAAIDRRDDKIKSLRREIKMLRDEVGLERGLSKLKAEVDQARQQARERELESLQCELGTLRNEIELKLNLKSELAAARAEIEDVRQRAPSFESELNGLREQVAKQEKTIRRLRGEQSQLAYAQKQLDAEQQKNRQQVSLTVTQMTASIGAQTREILHRLQENGFDLWETESPSGLIS